MRSSALRSGSAALYLLLLGGAVLPFVSVVAPAAAQTATTQQQLATWQGVWAASSQDAGGDKYFIEFVQSGGRLTGVYWKVGAAGSEDIGSVTVDPTRSSAEQLTVTALLDAGQSADMVFTLSLDRSFAKVVSKAGQRTAAAYVRRVAKVGAVVAAPDGASLRRAMINKWDTPLGVLTVAEDGTDLVGKITRPGGTTVLHTVMNSRTIRSEVQEWQVGTTPYSENEFRIVLAPDGRSFQAFAHNNRGLVGNMDYWEGTLAGGTPTTGTPPPTAPQPRPEPKPGYTPCNGWCEVKIVSSAVAFHPVGDGRSVPLTVIDLAVHNTAAEYRTLAPIPVGAETIAIVGSAGAFDHSKPALTSDGQLARTSAGPGGWPYMRESISLAPGAEARVTHRLGGGLSPQNLDRLLLRYQPEASASARFTDIAGGQQILCAHYAAEQRLKASGQLPYEVGALPAQCGTAPVPVPPPTPSPAPAPTPAPPPVVQQPAQPAPGTVQAGVFHPLERFDVRVDEVRAARDGKVHVFLTAANKSDAARSIGQGTFTAVMTDADGVGILTETVWRATGDEPKTFDLPPAVAPGGELKVRYILQPSVVHGPLTRIGVRESNRKVLFFDARSGDAGADSSAPPPAGGGAFKSLSKLDVRIDRAGPARDGRFEAFLTFRNPTREPQSATAAALRLTGTNSDGSAVTARYALYSARGERGENDALPVPVYVEAGGEMRVRYVFDDAPAGALTITDGTVTQTFTPGG